MVNVLYWLMVIELIGLLAFPLAFSLMPRLSDRGYSVAKPMGLLLLSWPLWFLGSLHLVPNTPYTLWGTLTLFSVVAGWFALRHRGDIAEFFRQEWRVIFISEGIFLLMYLAWVFYRAYDPSIDLSLIHI